MDKGNFFTKIIEAFMIEVFSISIFRPSLKHSSRRGSKAAVAEFTPEELLAGQFVVFTVYALLELPPTVGWPAQIDLWEHNMKKK